MKYVRRSLYNKDNLSKEASTQIIDNKGNNEECERQTNRHQTNKSTDRKTLKRKERLQFDTPTII